MDRIILQPGAAPLSTDGGNIQRNTMIALGYLAAATFGTNMIVDGLACNPTTPASMTVTIGQGMITQLGVIDASAFGSLAADNDPLLRIGINAFGSSSFTLAAPTTSGQSINYLIEATMREADGTPVVLPYYNPSNPAQPYSGPNNSGTAVNTVRSQTVQLQLKPGAAANAGTQTTPPVDSGWVGLYVITVNYGQTQITSANITTYPGAPFISPKLGPLGAQLRTKLQADLSLYVSPNGSDTAGNGSQQAPLRNMQAAWNLVINSYDLNGHNVAVNVADGAYTAGLLAAGTPLGIGSGNGIAFKGNTASPTSVSITTTNAHAVEAQGGAVFAISGMGLSASGVASASPAAAVVATTGGSISINGPLVFGNCAGQHIWVTQGGQVGIFLTGYTITGSAQSHFNAAPSSFINVIGPLTIGLSGSPNFSGAFAVASLGGGIQALNVTFSGNATGARYAAVSNGIIQTNGAGPNYFPGSIAGATSSGGQYV